MDHCEYFEEKSKHWTDKDKIDFNRDIKGVDNPIVVDIVNYEVGHIIFSLNVSSIYSSY